tara:strand:+ start:1131 stop:1361 length:231 start_codon:yes stop_codon:yes gene_type:complete
MKNVTTTKIETSKNKIERLVNELGMILNYRGIVSGDNMKVLTRGKDWLKTGNLYSNHDFDVSMSLKASFDLVVGTW